MEKIIKLTIKIMLTLLISLMIISIIFTALVDINQYKQEIVDLVKKEAGLKLEINGDLELTLFSGLKFSAENVRLSLGDELIADINSLNMGINAYSLYEGEPEITSMALDVKNLNIYRDKNNQLNFLPLLNSNIEKTDSHTVEETTTDKFSLNSFVINNIKLSIEQFQYLDDLESFSLKSNKVDASLSILPIIDHHDLVIDDPRILVDYIYSGELDVKKLFINEYQVSNLSLSFEDEKGNFVAKKLAFNFLQEGTNHTPPPVNIDAKGSFSAKLLYQTPEGSSEPKWSEPDIARLSQFDFNLSTLKVNQKQFQIETQDAHLVFDDIAVFEKNKFMLDNFLIKSLNFDTQKLQINLSENGKYDLNQVALKLKNVPVIYKSKMLNVISNTFFRRFSQGGNIDLSCSRLSHDGQELKDISLKLKGEKNKVALRNLSLSALESKFNTTGHILLSPKNSETSSTWQLDVLSEKLNLKPVAKVFNSPSNVEGYANINAHLLGKFNQSRFDIESGKVKTTANDLKLSGLDLDKVLEDFQSSQSVGLLDVTAVALLGPAGVLVTKGNDYRTLSTSLANKGNSYVKQLHSEISFSNGIANMDDVAFATKKYRLAMKGKINIKTKHFVNFNISTVDKQGCSVYNEEIKGSLDSPEVKKVNVLVSGVINPINSILSKVKNPLNLHCKTPFYSGVVEAPVLSK
ncbi:MAG: AsmA family protein [Gammaproteobacteria bacterium]|nr:AsmA family protein [Gammaproteobacteria bacterium]